MSEASLKEERVCSGRVGVAKDYGRSLGGCGVPSRIELNADQSDQSGGFGAKDTGISGFCYVFDFSRQPPNKSGTISRWRCFCHSFSNLFF